MRRMLTHLLFTTAVLAFAAGPVLAATGDPLPGVDVLVRKKPGPKPTTVHFGQFDCPEVPPDFFGPGSEPFTGDVDLKGMCVVGGGVDNDCDGPHSHTDYTEGTSPEIIDTEMNELTLRSIDPIAVNVGTFVELFDVRVTLSGSPSFDGAPCPGQFSMPVGTVLDPGVTSYVVDSFFDVQYRIEFFEAGTNNPAGGQLIASAHLALQEIDLPVTRALDGVQPVVLGYDGSTTQTYSFTSDGGGFDLALESVYGSTVASRDASWGAIKSVYR